MASENQIRANRENARHSTGPKTPEGKARSSANAIRHGLLARQIVLPIEDRAQYLELLAALEAEHQPEGPLETYLVHQMASAQWRLQRLTRIETGFFICRLEKVRELEYEDDDEEDDDEQSPAPLTPDEQFDEDTRLLGVLFHRDSGGDPFAKLARYENALQREFYKALDRFLDARARRTPPPPEKPNARNKPSSPHDGSGIHPCEPPGAAGPQAAPQPADETKPISPLQPAARLRPRHSSASALRLRAAPHSVILGLGFQHQNSVSYLRFACQAIQSGRPSSTRRPLPTPSGARRLPASSKR
ncbi:MAG: hypothetical protein ABSH05_00005 [Bryobacteraceae bacterium]|jgi:hypothetical protein